MYLNFGWMTDRNWYKEWFNSPFYHKLYFDRDEKEAERFISRLIDHLKPAEHSRMLDVACGKGRHSKFLASLGFEVTGIDISPESIQYASQFSTDRLQFYVHDMRLLFRVNYYDYAFNFFTSFGYFPTRREHDDAMRTISGCIKDTGTVLFDYLNVHFSEAHLIHEEKREIEGTIYEIHRWHDDAHFYKKITVTDPQLDTPIIHVEKVAKFSLGDFTEMLAFQEMQVTEVFGDYDLNPYEVNRSPRMIILAKKAK
jgi:SAM-dependent methyltransferase